MNGIGNNGNPTNTIAQGLTRFFRSTPEQTWNQSMSQNPQNNDLTYYATHQDRKQTSLPPVPPPSYTVAQPTKTHRNSLTGNDNECLDFKQASYARNPISQILVEAQKKVSVADVIEAQNTDDTVKLVRRIATSASDALHELIYNASLRESDTLSHDIKQTFDQHYEMLSGMTGSRTLCTELKLEYLNTLVSNLRGAGIVANNTLISTGKDILGGSQLKIRHNHRQLQKAIMANVESRSIVFHKNHLKPTNTIVREETREPYGYAGLSTLDVTVTYVRHSGTVPYVVNSPEYSQTFHSNGIERSSLVSNRNEDYL
jgi:hypothetical protein